MRQTINRLLLGSLSTKRIVLFMVTQVVGVVIILLSIYLYIDARKAVTSVGGESEYITVTKRVNTLSSMNSSRLGFSDSELSKLSAEKGILEVGEFVSSNFRVLGGISLPQLGVSYRTDMFFEAVSNEFIDVVSNEWVYSEGRDTVPIIIPKNYLNLYNYGFAPTNGLPRITESMVKSVVLDITVSDKKGRDRVLKGKIVGFSSRINTILAPMSFVEWGNSNYARREGNPPQRLIIKIDPSYSSSVSGYLKDRGYEPETEIFDVEGVNNLVNFLVSATLIIGVLIAVLSLALLLLSIYLIIERGKDKLFTLSSLGYSMKAITRPFVLLTVKNVSISFVIAYLIALAVRMVYIDILNERLDMTISGGGHLTVILFVLILFVVVTALISIMIKDVIRRII